jgi:hypothetical protein
MIKALDKISITHEVIHIHANNYGIIQFWVEFLYLNSWKLLTLRKKGNEFKKNTQVYPMKGPAQ